MGERGEEKKKERREMWEKEWLEALKERVKKERREENDVIF